MTYKYDHYRVPADPRIIIRRVHYWNSPERYELYRTTDGHEFLDVVKAIKHQKEISKNNE